MNRVVVTGMGVVSPIGSTLTDFQNNLRNGKSGITYCKDLASVNCACHYAGIPIYDGHNDEIINKYYIKDLDEAVQYALSAGIDAWSDAKFDIPEAYSNYTNEDKGVIVGSCASGLDYFARKKSIVDNGNHKKLGSWGVVNIMQSGPATFLTNLFAISGDVETISSACATGCESIAKAYKKIKSGEFTAMLAGGCDPTSIYVWSGFDAMRLLCRKHDGENVASRPMSADSTGFVPGAGAGMLVLENLEHALDREAKIYAEIIGVSVNYGGQRLGGSMTLPNSEKVIECISNAINEAKIKASDIDYINGHLTGTKADPIEISNWSNALGIKDRCPYLNSTKSMIGHTLGAAGSIEAIATILQMNGRFVHPSLNSRPLHPEIEKIYDSRKIPENTIENVEINYAISANFGFGDINACVVFKKYDNN